jgi:hypothetical protein
LRLFVECVTVSADASLGESEPLLLHPAAALESARETTSGRQDAKRVFPIERGIALSRPRCDPAPSPKWTTLLLSVQ